MSEGDGMVKHAVNALGAAEMLQATTGQDSVLCQIAWLITRSVDRVAGWAAYGRKER